MTEILIEFKRYIYFFHKIAIYRVVITLNLLHLLLIIGKSYIFHVLICVNKCIKALIVRRNFQN